MADDDEAARKARADSLRQQIESLKPNQPKFGQTSQEDSATDAGATDLERPAADEETPGESPREFVQRRMRELDKNN